MKGSMKMAFVVLVTFTAVSFGHARGQEQPEPGAQGQVPPTPEYRWEKEPKTFRDVPFGSDKTSDRATLPKGPCYDVHGTWTCMAASAAIGHVKTKEFYQFDENGRFVRVMIGFASKDFDFLRDAFVERYGAPTETKTDTVTNLAGAELQNETLLWEGPSVKAMIRRYTSDLTKGNGYVGERAFVEKEIEEHKEYKKKAARSF